MLLTRVGPDTVQKLERAATLRYSEGKTLDAVKPLGAFYLYGYAVEMRLKASYYRVIGLPVTANLDTPGPTGRSYRRDAETAIRSLPLLPLSSPAGRPVSPGHHVIGWGRLLEVTRATPAPGRRPMAAALALRMNGYASDVFDNWSEFLRYRTNRPRPAELEAVRRAAAWFGRNQRRLWS